jgi:hypothetical protein
LNEAVVGEIAATRKATVSVTHATIDIVKPPAAAKQSLSIQDGNSGNVVAAPRTMHPKEQA